MSAALEALGIVTGALALAVGIVVIGDTVALYLAERRAKRRKP